MTIAENLQRIQQAKTDIRNAIIEKGVQIDSTLTIDDFAEKILQIEGGGGEEFSKLINGRIQNIDIPQDIDSIRRYAFAYTYNLKSVNIPNNIKTVSDFAFWYCQQLWYVKWGSTQQFIQNGTFQGCTELQSIDFGNATQVMRFGANNTSTTVGSDGYIDRKVRQIAVPDNLYDEWVASPYWVNYKNKIIKKSVFDVPDVVMVMTDGTEKNVKLYMDLYNQKSLNTYGEYSNNQNIKELYFNAEVHHIADACFGYCTNLEKIVFKKGVNRIDSGCFNGCENLRTINFEYNPPSEIQSEAFANCSNLTEITIQGNTFYDSSIYDILPNCDNTAFNGTPFEKLNVFEENEVNEWDYWNVLIMKTDGSWHYFNFDYGYIPDNRFYGRDDIQEVTISDGLSINYGAFNGCSNLITITMTSNAIPSIDAEAFSNCYNLNYIQLLPGGAPYIDDAAFQNSGVGTIQYCESETDVWNTDWSKLIYNYGWNTENLC